MSHSFYLDVERCSGCFACVVACMDQNDIEPGAEPVAWRQVFAVETGAWPDARLRYVSLACMHCEDAPCVLACPTGAIQREPVTQVVAVDSSLCIGCHGCSLACPYGVPRFAVDGTMRKCDLCSERLKAGLEPACVRVCPTRALREGSPNELGRAVGQRAAQRLAGDG